MKGYKGTGILEMREQGSQAGRAAWETLLIFIRSRKKEG